MRSLALPWLTRRAPCLREQEQNSRYRSSKALILVKLALQQAEERIALTKLRTAQRRRVTAQQNGQGVWVAAVQTLLWSYCFPCHCTKQGFISSKITLLMISAYTVLQKAIGDPCCSAHTWTGTLLGHPSSTTACPAEAEAFHAPFHSLLHPSTLSFHLKLPVRVQDHTEPTTQRYQGVHALLSV